MVSERGSAGGGEIAGTLDPFELRGALADLMSPRQLAAEAPRVVAELAKITFGSSGLEPDRRDPRFTDAAWHDHPAYRRLGQSYLLAERTVNRLAAQPAETWERQARAQYAADILTSTAAPTNFLPSNPAALKRAFETGGMSLLRGTRNFLRDLRDNHGMPSMVDRRPFTVGENLACTPGAVVHREEMFELLQYTPNTATVRQRPLLMVPPQVNKFYVADLAPGRSLVEYAVAQGVQVFMIVWRNPRKGTTHGRWGLADYVSAQVRALDVVREITRSDQVNMLGVCAGGLTTAVTLGYLAAVGDADVGSATFLVTMLASTHPNAVGMMATQGGVDKVRHNAAQGTVIDGETLGRNFALLRPNDLIFGYVTNNWLLGNNPPAFDILAWNADTANLSSAFQRDTLGGRRTAAPPVPAGCPPRRPARSRHTT
jgi:polyhydroxyalkanoate synthase subunit PhaC